MPILVGIVIAMVRVITMVIVMVMGDSDSHCVLEDKGFCSLSFPATPV